MLSTTPLSKLELQHLRVRAGANGCWYELLLFLLFFVFVFVFILFVFVCCYFVLVLFFSVISILI